MIGDQYLLLPGPTPLPERIVRAMSRPMINHRGPEFRDILLEITAKIKTVYRTEGNVLVYPSSGTGVMEAAVANFIAPGDLVLVVSIGVFGDRFAGIAEAFGARVEKISVPWGKAVDAQVVADRLRKDTTQQIKAVLVSHNETSTGVVNDVQAVGAAMGSHPALLIVDTVSGLAAHAFDMDGWRVDVAASGSQKAFMIPPGLGFLAFNERALDVHRRTSNCRFYWDISNGLSYLEKGQTPTTPAISLFYGLQEALRMMADEGLDHIIARHRRYRDLIRSAMQTMGLDLLANEPAASCSLTSVIAPQEIGANQIIRIMREDYGIVLAGGQQDLQDVIFRVGHLGYVRELDLLAVVAALEITLARLGRKINFGAGVKQAQDFLLSTEIDTRS